MPKISALPASTELTDDDLLLLVDGATTTKKITAANAATYFGGNTTPPPLQYALSPEDTDLTTSHGITVRVPYELTLTGVRASLTEESSSGAVSVDIEVDGESILDTELTVDANERTSVTAATPVVIGTDYVADDAEVAFVVTADGTGARGLKVALYHTLGGTPPDGPGEITFVAASNTTYAGGRTTTTVDKPTGTVNGDYVLLGIVTGTTTEAVDPTPPAGFSLVAGPTDVTGGSFNVEMRVYAKFASGEPASWDFTHSSGSTQGFALTYRDVDTGIPLDTTPTTNTVTDPTPTTATGFTTVTDNAMVVFIAHDFADTTNNLTAPTGTTPTFTERIDVAPLIYVADGVMVTAGATGNKTQANNSTSGNPAAAILIALRPA